MQTELLTRDFQKPPPLKQRMIAAVGNWLTKNKQILQKLNNPKILTILALVLSFFVITMAITVITTGRSKTPNTTPLQTPLIIKPSTQPQIAQSGIDLEIENFVNKLEENQQFGQHLKQPIVDLDLNFN